MPGGKSAAGRIERINEGATYGCNVGMVDRINVGVLYCNNDGNTVVGFTEL